MKYLKSCLVLFLCLVSLCFYGCDKKSISQSELTRDNYNTGGNLSFYYDQQTQVAYFGGEGEVVQFYQEDIAKGWTGKGCRVGVSLLIPPELKDFKSSSAEIDGKSLNANDFIIEVNEEMSFAQFQPIVSKENSTVEIEITWEENTQSQTYKIIIQEGTIFMND